MNVTFHRRRIANHGVATQRTNEASAKHLDKRDFVGYLEGLNGSKPAFVGTTPLEANLKARE